MFILKEALTMIKCILLISFVFIYLLKTEVLSEKIESKISTYFASQIVKNFYDVWQKSRKGFEKAIGLALKESYGASGGTMNVYVKREGNPQELCDGYFLNDNVVNVILVNMFLRELPRLLMPDISLSLANNVLRLESKLCKMFIDADYALMRNKSDILYQGKHDPFENSPFVLQQVQTVGLLTVIAEDCHLIGEAVVTLTGVTPHIGHTVFRVVDCKFSIEIYQPGIPSPPVIAPYFSKQQSEELQNLLSQPISTELFSRLQGVVVSLVNTSAVFGEDMVQFRSAQKKIFTDTENYMAEVVRQLNKASIQENQGVIGMADLDVSWDDGNNDEKEPTYVKVTSVTLNGLDMAYASLRGGPIKMSTSMIADEIRFYRLQVRGKLVFDNSTSKGVYDFAAELHDVPVSVQINIDGGNTRKNQPGTKKLNKIDVQRWRDLIFTTGNPQHIKTKLMSGEHFILGYLIHEIPKAITKHLETVLEQAIDADSQDRKKLAQYIQYDDDDDKKKSNRRDRKQKHKKLDGMPLEPVEFYEY